MRTVGLNWKLDFESQNLHYIRFSSGRIFENCILHETSAHSLVLIRLISVFENANNRFLWFLGTQKNCCKKSCRKSQKRVSCVTERNKPNHHIGKLLAIFIQRNISVLKNGALKKWTIISNRKYFEQPASWEHVIEVRKQKRSMYGKLFHRQRANVTQELFVFDRYSRNPSIWLLIVFSSGNPQFSQTNSVNLKWWLFQLIVLLREFVVSSGKFFLWFFYQLVSQAVGRRIFPFW